MYYMPQYVGVPQPEVVPQPEYMPLYFYMPWQELYPPRWQGGYPVYPQQGVYPQQYACPQPGDVYAQQYAAYPQQLVSYMPPRYQTVTFVPRRPAAAGLIAGWESPREPQAYEWDFPAAPVEEPQAYDWNFPAAPVEEARAREWELPAAPVEEAQAYAVPEQPAPAPEPDSLPQPEYPEYLQQQAAPVPQQATFVPKMATIVEKQAAKVQKRAAAVAEQTSKPDTKASKALRAVSEVFFWVICIALVAGAVAFAVSRDPRKDILGYRTYNVKTESMTPQPDGSSPPGGFRAGDLIIVKTTEAKDIKVNDIITFNPSVREEDNQLFLTHRVVGILDELGGKPGIYFVTKGDYNNSEDPPISSNMLIGKKVFSIPKIGAFMQMVQDNFALAITTILCFFACIFMFKWYFAAPKKPKQSE